MYAKLKSKMSTIQKNVDIHFLSHFARTGSTFFCDRLSRHKKILIIPESKFLTIIYKELNLKKKINKSLTNNLINKLFQDRKFLNYKFKEKDLKKYFKNLNIKNWQEFFYYVCLYYKKKYKINATIIIFKKKESSKYFEEFKKIYKDTKLICMIRDPRGIYNSSKNLKHSVTGKNFYKNFFDFVIKYNFYLREIKFIFKIFDKDIMLLKYEDLTSKFNLKTKSTLKFLGLKKRDLSFLENKFYKKNIISSNDKYLHVNVKKNVMIENSNKWKKSISNFHRIFIYILCLLNIKYLNYKF